MYDLGPEERGEARGRLYQDFLLAAASEPGGEGAVFGRVFSYA